MQCTRLLGGELLMGRDCLLSNADGTGCQLRDQQFGCRAAETLMDGRQRRRGLRCCALLLPGDRACTCT